MARQFHFPLGTQFPNAVTNAFPDGKGLTRSLARCFAAMQLSSAVMDDWQCPVCLELLYKPCVNSCGHVFCFWCMHRAMDPYTPSQCPLCRAEYAHFPQVCEQLHFFLQKAFPTQYKEREKDIQEEEATEGVYSLELHPQNSGVEQASSVQPSATGHWSKSHFPCIACHKLLYNPVVLNCGHAVCNATCRPVAASPEDPVCPGCDAPSVKTPAVCTQWQNQLLQLLPEEMQDRSLEIAACSTLLQSVDRSKMSDPGNNEAVPSTSTSEQAVPGAAGEDTIANASARLRRRLLQAIRQDFSHHGVGCDACGLYPIKGRRYTCMDCPDKVGFDLCGKCHDKELHITGRFNQQHTPDHTMQLVRPMPTLFHIVQAANPELSMAQIRQLTGLAFDRHEGDLLGTVLAPQGDRHATATAAAQTQTQPSDTPAAAATGRQGSSSNQPAAAQHGRGRAGAMGGAATRHSPGVPARAELDRLEANTWAHDFTANAQQAANDAEASAVEVRTQEAAAPTPASDAGSSLGLRSLRQRGRRALALMTAAASEAAPQAHSRAQHDPTGQSWTWNLGGPASGQGSSREASPSSRQGSVYMSGDRSTPRRARESSGAESGIPRPWRRRRLQNDSAAVAADQSDVLQPQDSGAAAPRQSGSGSWRRLLPSFLGNILSPTATPSQDSAAPQQQPVSDAVQPADPWQSQTAFEEAARQVQLEQLQRHLEDRRRASAGVQDPTSSVNASHAEEQSLPSPPLPSVPNVWDGVASSENWLDLEDDDSGSARQAADTAAVRQADLIEDDVDYARGGDDGDTEHDAMMLILHAMRARSSESREAGRQGQGGVPQRDTAEQGRLPDAENAEQYWRDMEAASEADFIAGQEEAEREELQSHLEFYEQLVRDT